MGLRDKYIYHEHNIFFITTTCYKWLQLLCIGNSMNIILESLNYCRIKYHTSILGYVIMPNHLHLIAYFKKRLDRVNFMRDFKKYTSTRIREEVENEVPNLLDELRYNNRKQHFKVWQDRFDELFLDNQEMLEIKLEYIHANPLQEHWRLAIAPEKYPYSSAAYYELGKAEKLHVSHYMNFV